jgi:Uma2 family endonuclease
MAETATASATYADIEALPPHVVGEILIGRLVTHPRPTPRHIMTGSAVSGILSGPYQFGDDGPGRWVFAAQPELHLGLHVTVPDIAGWRRKRLTPAVADKAYFDIAPDWICELLSPSTERYDKGDKRRICATYGVPHLWHLDPPARTLEVFLLQEQSWLLTHTFVDQDEVSAPPFDAITFSPRSPLAVRSARRARNLTNPSPPCPLKS